MTTKEHLKNYRTYKAFVKYYDRQRAEKRLLGIEPAPDDVAARDRYACKAAVIESAIAGLADPTEQLLLRQRYIEGWSWTKVCFNIHYSKTQAQRIHARALEHLDKVLKMEEVEA